MLKRGANMINIKRYNRSLILSTIANKKVSRKDLAKLVNLTPAAITILVNEMIDEGIIIETGEHAITNKVGRKTKFIVINKNHHYLIGIGIETDSITISISNLYKEVLSSTTFTHQKPSFEDTLQRITSTIPKLVQEANIKPSRILGAGVGIVGLLDSDSGTSIQAFGLWKKPIPLKDILEEKLGIPVVIDNNVRALALAEIEQRDYSKDLVFIKYAPGIGAALIIDHEVFSGNTYNSLEFGHTIMDPNGKECNCGQAGCLETIGSYISIKQELIEHYDKTTILKDITSNNILNIHTKEILHSYHQGDEFVIKTIHKALQNFSLGLFNLIKVLDLKAFIIYGTFFQSDVIFNVLKEYIDVYRKDYSFRLQKSTLTNDKSIGAIALARKTLFFDTGANMKGEKRS